MEFFFDLLKLTIPSLVVFLTVYYLFKTYLDGQLRLKAMELEKQKGQDGLPLKLQAYERLALFCERIRLNSLVFRLNQTSMSEDDLAASMLIAIEKEYEHNMAQQIYVSDSLWKIIHLAKTQNQDLVHASMQSSKPFLQALQEANAQRTVNPVDHAIAGIRKEMSLIL